MKKTKLTRSLLAACSIVALSAVMYGCTGDGSKDELVATQGDLDQEREAHATTQAALDTANGEVTRLSTTLGAEMDPDPDSVRGMLAAATARIGAADDPGSLLGMLDAEQKEAMRLSTLVGELETELGDETNPDPESVRGMLNAANDSLDAANTRIGSVDDPTSLLGMLDAEQKKAEMYRVAIEGDGTDANPGLQAELDAAKLRIAALEAGTADDVLDPIKTAASDAATAAGTASTAAGAAADAAEEADDNRATIQTGEANSVADAMAARDSADTAEAEAMKAQTASTAAQGATTTGEATPYRLAAEAAQADAEAAQADAEAAQAEAEADAMAELKIVEKTKSVGDNEITVSEDTHTDERTINGVTTTEITGKVFDIETEGVAILGTGDDPDTDVVEADVPGAEARGDVEIGGWWDSVDDDARLALVTKYAGTQTVTAYENGMGTPSGSKPNVVDEIDHDNNDGTAVRTLPLRRASGTFMAASGLTVSGTIAAATKAQAVYYYDTTDARVYVRPTGSAVDGGTTTYSYQVIDTRAGAKIPRGNDYEHLHFGLWADLKTTDAVTGTNALDDLGIGFVTALADGDGMTEDMPNHGDARYSGNWVAAIQALHEDGEGDISLEGNAAEIEANFRRGSVEIGLTGFVTLDGDIEGNRFTGSYVDAELDFDDVDAGTDGTQALGTLNATGEYDGTVNGGFFGDDAEEIGGVFEFTSDDNEDGAFRGSFGAHEDEDVSID